MKGLPTPCRAATTPCKGYAKTKHDQAYWEKRGITKEMVEEAAPLGRIDLIADALGISANSDYFYRAKKVKSISVAFGIKFKLWQHKEESAPDDGSPDINIKKFDKWMKDAHRECNEREFTTA